MMIKIRKYIDQQLHIAQAFMYRMVKINLMNPLYTKRISDLSWCKTGARTSELVDIIQG